MKIFELRTNKGEREWISGNTIIEALKTYFSTTGMDINDLNDDDDIVEIPKEKWSEIIIINDEYDKTDPDDFKEITLEQWIKENPTSEIIAGNMY